MSECVFVNFLDASSTPCLLTSTSRGDRVPRRESCARWYFCKKSKNVRVCFCELPGCELHSLLPDLHLQGRWVPSRKITVVVHKPLSVVLLIQVRERLFLECW